MRERWTGWGTRLSFGALLLVFSEWIVWQTPTEFTALEWAGLVALYLAFAALSLDLIERFTSTTCSACWCWRDCTGC
jgi:hypothetical protein